MCVLISDQPLVKCCVQSKEGVKQKLARLLSLSKHCSVSRLSGRMTALLDLSRN